MLAGAIAGIPATAAESGLIAESETLAADPSSARYEIDGKSFALDRGLFAEPAAAGSASAWVARITGDPVFGDLDGDGDEDAVLWLVHESGGSGTFYYVAAAFREGAGFRGSQAAFVGDRIAPGLIAIGHRIATAHYVDRRPDQPMCAQPALEASVHFRATTSGLARIAMSEPGASLAHGWLVVGHEVRTLTPCGSAEPLWLSGNPSVVASLLQRYREALPESAPYTPLFATLVGRIQKPSDEGFGADYAGAYAVNEIAQLWPEGNCISNRVVIESPLPGATVKSPLVVGGRARGSWFFEGEVQLLLLDAARNVLARGFATARSNWMTRDFVPFEGTLTFADRALPEKGVLVVQRNNPSDDRSLDEALEVPILLD